MEELQTQTSSSERGWSISKNSTEKTSTKNVTRLDEIVQVREQTRLNTGLHELNRVLGGGLVKGSYILLGGDPGIGKSTLLMQMAGRLADNSYPVLYVSGEESVDQAALRAQRLGVRSHLVQVASESQLSQILALAKKIRPEVLIVDSIQTVYLPEISSAPGTVSQVRECAAQLMALAKSESIAVVLVGHVTKDGHIAGPKTLEHMVDTVLSFEGDANHQFRLLRAQKNRFGATNELGVFQMIESGLEEVSNPSQMFLAERGESLVGSTVFSAMEGSRPLLCEVQSLTTSTFMAMPRRTAVGFDTNRIHLLAAVMDKHLEYDFSRQDIFVNVVGGLKITEPAADLAVAAAMVSAIRNLAVPSDTVFFGEVGLTGEVRAATFASDRLREAEKLGFKKIVLPYGNQKTGLQISAQSQMECQFIKNVSDLVKVLNESANTRTNTKRQKKDIPAEI